VEVAAHGVVDEAACRLDLATRLVLEHHVLIPPAGTNVVWADPGEEEEELEDVLTMWRTSG
jgi:hypothetical protein